MSSAPTRDQAAGMVREEEMKDCGLLGFACVLVNGSNFSELCVEGWRRQNRQYLIEIVELEQLVRGIMANVVGIFTGDHGNVYPLRNTPQNTKSRNRSRYVDKFVFAADDGLSSALNNTISAVVCHGVLEFIGQ